MYYISSVNDSGLFGITDASDGVEEFYSIQDIYDLFYSREIRICGVFFGRGNRNRPAFRIKTARTLFLDSLKDGTPLRIKSKYLQDWKQVIYLGRKQGVYYFFDGNESTGRFAESEDFINSESSIRYDTEHNDKEEVARLLYAIKKCNKE